jgi:hypothetical protein
MYPTQGTPALTEAEIFQARADGRLNDNEKAFFLQAIKEKSEKPENALQNRQFNALMDGYKAFVTRSNPFSGIVDANGDQRYYEFSVASRALFDNGIKSGKSLEEIEKQVLNLVPKYQIPVGKARQMVPGYATKGLQPLAPVEGGAPTWKPGMSMDELDRQLSQGKK